MEPAQDCAALAAAAGACASLAGLACGWRGSAGGTSGNVGGNRPPAPAPSLETVTSEPRAAIFGSSEDGLERGGGHVKCDPISNRIRDADSAGAVILITNISMEVSPAPAARLAYW
jgi:hypothetical protein